MNFSEVFKQATGYEPFEYQRELAHSSELPSLLEVPTGMGKTAAAILCWLWRRQYAEYKIRAVTPRRLVYCLPMRVLVEQTRDCAVAWLYNLVQLSGVAQFEEAGGERKLKTYDPWPGDAIPIKFVFMSSWAVMLIKIGICTPNGTPYSSVRRTCFFPVPSIAAMHSAASAGRFSSVYSTMTAYGSWMRCNSWAMDSAPRRNSRLFAVSLRPPLRFVRSG